MKTFLAFLFVAVFFTGCNHDVFFPPKDGETPTVSLSEKLYPLHVGDNWVFTNMENQVGIMKLYVRGTEKIEKNTYFIVEQSSDFYRYAVIPRYYRTEGDKVYQYDMETKTENVIIDFGSEEPNEDAQRAYVTSRGTSVTVPAGTFTVTSTMAPAAAYDGAPFQDFADGVGLVKMVFMRGAYELHHAIIDGKKIGKD